MGHPTPVTLTCGRRDRVACSAAIEGSSECRSGGHRRPAVEALRAGAHHYVLKPFLNDDEYERVLSKHNPPNQLLLDQGEDLRLPIR
ncbi:MAG: hypothetical protein HC826_02180 [Rhodospirillales bacterium]|nr:hypothetical protein [Rhodospirillales bacterium]